MGADANGVRGSLWRSRRFRWGVRIVFVAALVPLPGCYVRAVLYPAPDYAVPEAPAPLEEVRLDLADGTAVFGWAYVPEEGDAGAPAIAIFHGNGENLGTMGYGGIFDDFRGMGCPFLAIDYPGYGRSGGRPSEKRLLAAGDAAWAWLGERFPGRPRVACGWSLGAAVAIQTAARNARETDGVILLSPWSTLRSVAGEHFPRWLVLLFVWERYDSLAAAGRMRCPVLVVHGDRDASIPIRHGEAVAAALPRPARWMPVPGAGHNDLLARESVWRTMREFLATAGSGHPVPIE